MMKSYFVLEDNIIDKKLVAFLNSMQFARRKQSNILSKHLMTIYAKHFTENNMEKAEKVLDSHHNSMRKKDGNINKLKYIKLCSDVNVIFRWIVSYDWLCNIDITSCPWTQ